MSKKNYYVTAADAAQLPSLNAKKKKLKKLAITFWLLHFFAPLFLVIFLNLPENAESTLYVIFSIGLLAAAIVFTVKFFKCRGRIKMILEKSKEGCTYKDFFNSLNYDNNDSSLLDGSYIAGFSILGGPRNKYRISLASRGYGWDYILEEVDYLVRADIDNITHMLAFNIGAKEPVSLLREFSLHGGRLTGIPELVQREFSSFELMGHSKELDSVILVSFYNQTRFIEIESNILDPERIIRYAETLIRRTFNTSDSMKLARPYNGENNASDNAGASKAGQSAENEMYLLMYKELIYIDAGNCACLFEDTKTAFSFATQQGLDTKQISLLKLDAKTYEQTIKPQLPRLGIEKTRKYQMDRTYIQEPVFADNSDEKKKYFGQKLNNMIVKYNQALNSAKKDILYKSILKELFNTVFLVPICYEGEAENSMVSDGLIHYTLNASRMITKINLDESIKTLEPDADTKTRRYVFNNESGEETMLTGMVSFYGDENYRFPEPGEIESGKTMCSRNVMNNGKTYLCAFTDLVYLKSVFGDNAMVAAFTFEDIVSHIDDGDSNGTDITGLVINPDNVLFTLNKDEIQRIIGEESKPIVDPYYPQTVPLMLSQYAARYVYNNDETAAKEYKKILISIGFLEDEAERLFNFECDILRKYNKKYLLEDGFTRMWFFGLSQPFFDSYPKEKEDILKEHFLTLSELCKIIDEAEFHYWNSHERDISDECWNEIYAWHLKGQGGDFAVKYFDMTAQETGIPREKIGYYSAHEGSHIKYNKWR